MAPPEPFRVGIWPVTVFSKWTSKQLAKLYDHIVFQVAVFDFMFSHKNTLHEEDRLIKHP